MIRSALFSALSPKICQQSTLTASTHLVCISQAGIRPFSTNPTLLFQAISTNRTHCKLSERPLFTIQQRGIHNDDKDPDSPNLYIEDNLKLDIKDTEPETTVIEANPVSTGREGKLVKAAHDNACTLCRLNLRNLSYTDVMILSQYIKRNGSLVTYHESKLCSKQYKKIERLIKQAQRCNLIPRPADYLVPGTWHDLNTYLEIDRKRDQPMKVIKKEYWKL
ncbi:28S ribosomal S18a, mitochondrial [Olea europaea subsp. europaea]|uniref:Small ribosomal subunit protein bS18c n=1 Tax=Olea europaea subsp. europaea TaxID=158383 RepID=A0A8S0VPS5_OLEEU|nr:28S ribosomal S18a, mitochondrial [Olea europaea subsp. europaea]